MSDIHQRQTTKNLLDLGTLLTSLPHCLAHQAVGQAGFNRGNYRRGEFAILTPKKFTRSRVKPRLHEHAIFACVGLR